MRYRYLSDARGELDQKIGEYEKDKSGLGLDFLDEVESAISRIISNPRAWTQIDTGIRRCLTHRFPYGVVYQYREKEQEILVLAVMHTHRRPGYWRHRI